jgi:hypothetical protein
MSNKECLITKERRVRADDMTDLGPLEQILLVTRWIAA